MIRALAHDATAASPQPLPEPTVLARLLPYLTQSIMVVRRDWSVVADLAPPQGLLGHGSAVRTHPFSSMHPDDVERVAGFAQEAMNTSPGWSGSLEFRAQRADGSYGCFRIEVHNRLDDPVLLGMVVVTTEVPDPDPDAEGVPPVPSDEDGEPRMDVVGDHLPLALILLDAEGQVTNANRAACELLGTDVETLRAGRPPAGFGAADQQAASTLVQRLLAAPGKETLTAMFGTDPPRLLKGTFVSRVGETSGGAVELVIITIEDVTHRLAREQHLEHRANHDSLTGLPNRGWLLDHVDERLARGVPLVVAFVDLDGFKVVNDEFGHATGDDLLAEIAGALRGALVAGESVARVGGDEFVVVAERVDRPAGKGPAHAWDLDDLRVRIRHAVHESPGARRHDVGVSIGLTESRPGDKAWDMMGRADAAMYEDKRRNS